MSEPRTIITRRREHEATTTPPKPGGRYAVYTVDSETDGWEEYETGLTLFELRKVIRRLEAGFWSSMSYLIERED